MEFTRADVRLDTLIPGKVTAMYDENGAQLPKGLEVDVNVTNISATGMSIECKQEFLDTGAFYLNVTIAGTKLNIIIQIKRKEHLDNGNWSYGCMFMHLDDKEEAAIRKYIFDTQLLLRRKKMYQEEQEKLKQEQQNKK